MSFSLVIAAAAQKKIAFPNLFFISVPFNWPRSTLTHSLGGEGRGRSVRCGGGGRPKEGRG